MEHSDGLDDGELPARTEAAVETRLRRLKRIALFSARLLAAPSASDEAGGLTGTMWTTTGGRRSARLLTSTTKTGSDGLGAPKPHHDCRTVGCLRQAPGPFPPAAGGIRELHCCVRCYDTNGGRHSRECDGSTTDLPEAPSET